MATSARIAKKAPARTPARRTSAAKRPAQRVITEVVAGAKEVVDEVSTAASTSR